MTEELMKRIADVEQALIMLGTLKVHLPTSSYEEAKKALEDKLEGLKGLAKPDPAAPSAPIPGVPSPPTPNTVVDLSVGNKSKSWLIVLLDNTGSMNSIIDDTIGGFNNFLQQQVTDSVDECRMSLIKFNEASPWEVVHAKTPIGEITPLSRQNYLPRSNTPLLDAIGKTLMDTAARLQDIKPTDRPARVSMIIITDGMENASKEFAGRRDVIFKMIEDMKKGGVVFTFLASNQDAIAEGGGIGVARASSLTLANTGEGVKHMFATVSRETTAFRKGMRPEGYAYTDADRQTQEKAAGPSADAHTCSAADKPQQPSA
jgi:hypothetical protein